MWQYWWWFWFTYYITVYFFLFSRLIRHRVLKFSPKISTTQKAHGKWGDFLICFVPITWCVNILSNSNFILRMLEWQTESSLLTIRVRGRQWYWVYKIELKDLLKTINVVKNIGHNYWEQFNNISILENQNSLNLIQLKRHNEVYLKALLNNFKSLESQLTSTTKILAIIDKQELNVTHTSFNTNKRTFRLNNVTTVKPMSTVQINNIFQLNWNSNTSTQTRDTPDSLYFVLKQKRFAPAVRKANTAQYAVFEKHLNLTNTETLAFKTQSSQTWKWMTKRLKYKTTDIASAFNKRLLRTRRILVLPTGVNLTVITNSFDVVHSWYIPGLGIKLDCIPGRSTHHTLFIDHAGFYYGQCAEICGRYHHHMPIRVCALPYEHFMIWWYHYGLPYFNNLNDSRKESIRSGIRQYNW